MKLTLKIIVIFFSGFLISSCEKNKAFIESDIVLIPQVRNKTVGNSSFLFNKKTKFVVESVEQHDIIKDFNTIFEKSLGWKPEIIIGGKEKNNQIYFRTIITYQPEAYELEITEQRIEIKASKPAGFFYALQTLRQLFPPEIESNTIQKDIDLFVPEIHIIDNPKYKWRGFMLDVSRHFFQKEDIFRMIDNLSIHKINTLHLHLVDDQGWRLEIKKYPGLTKKGAWRVNHEDKPWNSRPEQKPGEAATYGGFYTRADMKEIVEYAQKKFINIVPEIEMPAHVSSALAAYPQFSCSGGPFSVPSGGVWPITDIYCAGKDSTFLFLQDILSEVMEIFPSKYIHIGGDEATKTEWGKCPDCKSRIKSERLKNTDELQSYFITRIADFLKSNGRVMLGWDEILEGGLAEGTAVMSWRGFEGGIEAARKNHEVIMSPITHCYFDYYQGQQNQEPIAIGGYIPLRKVHEFNPVPDNLDKEATKYIIGGQANLWTEYVKDIKHAEYMTFPRIAALSEKLWNNSDTNSWEDFAMRIQQFMKRYQIIGINYSKSLFKVIAKPVFISDKKQIEVTLECEMPDLPIYFTKNGEEPTNHSEIYTKPIIIDKTTNLKAVTVTNGSPSVTPLNRNYNIGLTTGKEIKFISDYCENHSGTGNYTLVNGISGSQNFNDKQWQGWDGKNMEIIIDLKDLTDIQYISLGAIENRDAWIFFPEVVEFRTSINGITFSKVGSDIAKAGFTNSNIQLYNFDCFFEPTKARFVKIIAKNLGLCPKGHSGEGKPAWIFFDEIIVK